MTPNSLVLPKRTLDNHFDRFVIDFTNNGYMDENGVFYKNCVGEGPRFMFGGPGCDV